MTFQNFLLGIATILFGIMLWAIGFAIVKLIWHGLVSLVKGTFRWFKDLYNDPKTTLIESNFFVQLIALPFFLTCEKLYKWIYPKEYSTKKANSIEQNAITDRSQEILKRDGAECVYVEGSSLCIGKVSEIEVSNEHLVRFTVTPLQISGFVSPAEPWSCGVKWEYFFYDSSRWRSEYYLLRWRLYFNPTLIEQLRIYAKTLPDDMQQYERFDALNVALKKILGVASIEVVTDEERWLNPKEMAEFSFTKVTSLNENEVPWIDSDEMNDEAEHAGKREKQHKEAWERPWIPCIADLYEKLVTDKDFDPFEIVRKVPCTEQYVASFYLYPNLEGYMIDPVADDCYRLIMPAMKDVTIIQFNGEQFYQWWKSEFPEERAAFWHSPYTTVMISAMQSGSLASLQGVFKEAVTMRDFIMMCLWGLRVELIEDIPEMMACFQEDTSKHAFSFTGKKGDTGYIMTYLPYALSEFNLAQDAPVWVTTPWEIRAVAIPWRKLKIAQNVSARIELLKALRTFKLSQSEPDNWREQWDASPNLAYKTDAFRERLWQLKTSSKWVFRDTNLDAETLALYQVGVMFREPTFCDSTYKFGGLIGNTRFTIVTSSPRSLDLFPQMAECGLTVFEPHQIFKVIQTENRGAKHLVTLLHIPEDCLEYFKSSESIYFENMLTWQTLDDFEEALTLQPISELQSEDWEERTSMPVGINPETKILNIL